MPLREYAVDTWRGSTRMPPYVSAFKDLRIAPTMSTRHPSRAAYGRYFAEVVSRRALSARDIKVLNSMARLAWCSLHAYSLSRCGTRIQATMTSGRATTWTALSASSSNLSDACMDHIHRSIHHSAAQKYRLDRRRNVV